MIETNAIIQGDCLDVMREMPDNSIDFIFTDPPYGHGNNDGTDLIARTKVFGGGRKYTKGTIADGRPILNDGIEANDLFRQCLPEFFRILKPGSCCCCCCGGGGPDPQFARWSLWMDKVFAFKQMIIWDKGWGLGWHYHRCYETVLVGEKPGAACRWFDTTKQIGNVIRHIPKIIPQKNQHPTEKPVRLSAHFIKLHTQPGDVVFDPFCGSGSTLIAAKRNGRRYIGAELDPKWHKHATERVAADTLDLPFFEAAQTGRGKDEQQPLFEDRR